MKQIAWIWSFAKMLVCHVEFAQKVCSNIEARGQKHPIFSDLQSSNSPMG